MKTAGNIIITRTTCILAAVTLLLCGCHDIPSPPPWLLDWPEPVTTLESREGGALLLVFSVKGINASMPHTLWWAWDNDPNSTAVRLQMTKPETTPEGTFVADEGLELKISGYRRGDHVLKILVHNTVTGKDILASYAVHVEKRGENLPLYTEPEVIGVTVYPNWQD